MAPQTPNSTGLAVCPAKNEPARQAETELRLLDVAERRDALIDQRARMTAKRTRQARADRAKRWVARWAAVRSATGTLRARLASAIPVLVGGVAMGAPILIGWN